MIDKPWLFHLDEEDRSTLHLALVDLCDAFARWNVWASVQDGGGKGGVVLPRAIRIGGQRRAARLRIVELGLSVSAPATRASASGYLHLLGPMPDGRDMISIPRLAARWRDEFGNDVSEHRIAAARNDERARQIVRGCLELLHMPWMRTWVSLDPLGFHSLTVTPPPDRQTGDRHFAARPLHPSVGGMTDELVEELSSIVREGVHVFERSERWPPGALPTAHISDGYSFHMWHDGGPLDAMRVMRAVPQGARLIMPPS